LIPINTLLLTHDFVRKRDWPGKDNAMTTKTLLTIPLAIGLYALAATGVSAAIDGVVSVAPEAATLAPTSATVRVHMAQVEPKSKAIKRKSATPKKTKARCPQGEVWDSEQRKCVPGAALTPIQMPATR
jgi:hypothetical protein